MSRLAHYLTHLQRFGIKPGLERIRALLAQVGNPQLDYPILLVGGTNGKGSTAEFAARLLTGGNRHIGLYTSPHLYEWNERLRVLPGPPALFEGSISDQDLDALFDAALPHIEAIAAELGQPTEFEVVTLLGLWHFSRQRVDAAVVEVGLGGRWDATNVTEPLVSVITHVALDHCDRLGDTLEEIGADKVHIARSGRTLLTAETNPSVLQVFEEYCRNIGAQVKRVATPHSADFQEINSRLAAAAAQEFALAAGWEWEAPHLNATELKVPGRCEVIAHSPLLILDGANNPEGAEVLAKQLTEGFGLRPENTLLVLGILADKDWRAMTRALVPLARHVVVTQSESARALGTEELAGFVNSLGVSFEIVPGVPAAVNRARELASAADAIIVTGSFTTIAEVPRT